MNQTISKWSLSIAVGLVCLIVGIIGIETFFWLKRAPETHWVDPNTQFDSELGWNTIPDRNLQIKGWGTLSSNSHGFRSPEIESHKRHVLVLGDSVAWGYGVDDQTVFTHQLQGLLEGTRLQIHNLAVSGYGLDQYYLYLKRHIERFPIIEQIILVLNSGNDLVDIQGNYCYGKSKPYFQLENGSLSLKNERVSQYSLRNLFSSSYFLERLIARWPPLRLWLSKLAGDVLMSEEEAYQVAPLIVQKIQQLANSKGAKFKILLSPTLYDFSNEFEDYAWLKNYCASFGKNCVDFRETLLNDSEIEPKNLFTKDNVHYTKEGHAYLTKTIYQKFFTPQSSPQAK